MRSGRENDPTGQLEVGCPLDHPMEALSYDNLSMVAEDCKVVLHHGRGGLSMEDRVYIRASAEDGGVKADLLGGFPVVEARGVADATDSDLIAGEIGIQESVAVTSMSVSFTRKDRLPPAQSTRPCAATRWAAPTNSSKHLSGMFSIADPRLRVALFRYARGHESRTVD